MKFNLKANEKKVNLKAKEFFRQFLQKKIIKKHKKCVHFHLRYVFTSQTNISGGGDSKPLAPLSKGTPTSPYENMAAISMYTQN